MQLRLLVLGTLMLSSLAAYGDDNVRMEEKTVTVNDKALTVEVARTIEEQRKGLMFRTELAADRGMVFVFTPVRPVAMWMKNTLIPLSVAFIDKDLDAAFLDEKGCIFRIASMKAKTLDLHRSELPAAYVVETNGGWFDFHNVKPGDCFAGIKELRPRR